MGASAGLYTLPQRRNSALRPVRHVERLARRGHSLPLAFCSNLSFSSDSAAKETGKREAVSFDIKAGALISTD